MDRSLIDRYAAQADALTTAADGLTREQLTAHPVPNTWSIQQIVLHLMDSDLIGSDRMKRVIAETRPLLIGYNETAFSQGLYYEQLDPAAAAQAFRANRLLTAEILRRLPDEAFSRIGIHNEHGAMTLADLVRAYVDHVDHHMRFVREKRAMLGKPL